ncbi:MAG: nucleotidyltransferase domain-containing protein [Pseudomonadota bacterium]
MIDLKNEYIEEIKAILSKHAMGIEVRMFGSRVNKKARPNSDIDLVLIDKNKISFSKLNEIKQVFSESNIPYIVDVIDWHSISESFQNIILENYIVLQK